MKNINNSTIDQNPLIPKVVVEFKSLETESNDKEAYWLGSASVLVNSALFTLHDFNYSEIRTLFEIIGKLEFNKDFVQIERLDDSIPLLIEKKLIYPMSDKHLCWYWINPGFMFKGIVSQFVEKFYPAYFTKRYNSKLDCDQHVTISTISNKTKNQ